MSGLNEAPETALYEYEPILLFCVVYLFCRVRFYSYVPPAIDTFRWTSTPLRGCARFPLLDAALATTGHFRGVGGGDLQPFAHAVRATLGRSAAERVERGRRAEAFRQGFSRAHRAAYDARGRVESGADGAGQAERALRSVDEGAT